MRSRREVLLMGVSALALPLLAAGCNDPGTGPVEIRYDREACALCQMIISDRRFAAQVRGGPEGAVYKFDDLGCGINWLAMQEWVRPGEAEIWVMDAEDGETWLNARRARYRGGVFSPMDYGFAALSGSPPDTLDFAAMTAAVLERGSAYCEPGRPRTADI